MSVGLEKNVLISVKIDDESNSLFEISKKLNDSTNKFDVPMYVLSNEIQQEHVNNNCHFLPVQVDKEQSNLSLNFLRWELFFKFLVAHPEIEKVALVDLENTEMLKNPFDEIEDGYLYIGDEYNNFATGIIRYDRHPRYIDDFLFENPNLQLLNSGIVAGNRNVIIEFLTIFSKLATQSEVDALREKPDSLLGDYEASLVNYISYNYFSDRLIHGRKVSTRFKYNETESDAWFKHH